MNCEEFRQLIDLYDNFSDNELLSDKKLEFRIHQKECDNCRSEQLISNKIKSSLQRLNSIEVSSHEIEDFKHLLRNQNTVKQSHKPQSTPLFPFLPFLTPNTLRFAGGFAAFLLMVAASVPQINNFTGARPAKEPADSYRQSSQMMPVLAKNQRHAAPPDVERQFHFPANLNTQSGGDSVFRVNPFDSDSRFLNTFHAGSRNNNHGKSPLVFVANNENFAADSGSQIHPFARAELQQQMDMGQQHNLARDLYQAHIEKFLMKKYAIRKLEAYQPASANNSDSARESFTLRGNSLNQR